MNTDPAQIAAHGTAQRLDALDKLIAAVEAGQENAWHGCGDVLGFECGVFFQSAFNGSLDAALALHNALFPGWGWRVTQLIHGKPRAAIAKYPVVAVDVIADSPARAWLLAILKAYRAQIAQETA